MIDIDRMPEYLAGFEEAWKATKNPVHVWSAIAICCQHGAPFPAWVREYLEDCAKRLLGLCGRGVDIRDQLKGIFGFTGWAQLAEMHSELEHEKFAMAFAAHIFAGKHPQHARDYAANEFLSIPDKTNDTLNGYLTKFFGVTTGWPRGRNAPQAWRDIIVDWLAGTLCVSPTIPACRCCMIS